MKSAQNFKMSEHFYFGLVVCKAMMLAVFFKLVFIVCTIRASQGGYSEALQSQHCSKARQSNSINTIFSTVHAKSDFIQFSFFVSSFVALISN